MGRGGLRIVSKSTPTRDRPNHRNGADPIKYCSLGLLLTLSGCAGNASLTPNIDGPEQLVIAPASMADDSATLGLNGLDLAKYKRNFTVGQYLEESDRMCSDYLKNLTRVQRDYGLAFGSLSTFFGGLGAAFSKASVVRPLSAAAGFSSAERAEIDADTFARQTAQVIIAGIKNSRARTYDTIVQSNFSKSVMEWPLSVALADIQDYHLRCSLHEGITEAAASVGAAAPSATSAPSATDPAHPTGPAGRSEGPPSADSIRLNSSIGAGAGALSAGGNAASVVGAQAGALAGGANTNVVPGAAQVSGATAGALAVASAPKLPVSPPPPPPPPKAQICESKAGDLKTHGLTDCGDLSKVASALNVDGVLKPTDPAFEQAVIQAKTRLGLVPADAVVTSLLRAKLKPAPAPAKGDAGAAGPPPK